ncbi:MAG TPA: hypothetical protein VL986_05850 [Terracidiphilus sp.]|nr:hypothetical protein [Terracidiphilus sp.]
MMQQGYRVQPKAAHIGAWARQHRKPTWERRAQEILPGNIRPAMRYYIDLIAGVTKVRL